MLKMHKKIAGPECNQNQRETVSETTIQSTIYSSTPVLEKQGISIPVFSMAEESAEYWNAKAARINAESAYRRLMEQRWEVAV